MISNPNILLHLISLVHEVGNRLTYKTNPIHLASQMVEQPFINTFSELQEQNRPRKGGFC
jgi:hypothetical protein